MILQTFKGFLITDVKDFKNDTKSFSISYKPYGHKDKYGMIIQCTVFKDHTARLINIIKTLKKGTRVLVSGIVSDLETYESQEGTKAKIKFTIYHIEFAETKERQDENSNYQSSQTYNSNGYAKKEYTPNQVQKSDPVNDKVMEYMANMQ